MTNTQTTVTRPLICPHCEVHKLVLAGGYSARCTSCRAFIAGPLLATLRGITTLPDAVGRHACECGHPEMRLLPDGVYRCPSCRAEILPVTAPPVDWRPDDRGEAYWWGWLDGRYGERVDFTRNRRLQALEDPAERLNYYKGHRAGRETRAKSGRPSKAV